MLERVSIEGVNLPRLYIAENMQDVQIARANGIPYVRWKYGQEQLVKQLLRPALEKMFPGIAWSKVLGRKKPVRSNVVICKGNIDKDKHGIAEYDADEMIARQYEYDDLVDDLQDCTEYNAQPDLSGEYERLVPIAGEQRDICADNSSCGYGSFVEDRLKIEDYVGDLSSSVDIDALQKLGMLPQFVGDIADCIKLNLSNSMRWTEGYTKKLGATLGNFKNSRTLPNLIILDISASIPDGIAATMITLADTLRSQCNAELIITSCRSGYYSIGCELPKPQTIRNYYGRGNEGAEFMAILSNHISGREFGYVISFGDWDSPGNWCSNYNKVDLQGTKVHEVRHYHTFEKESTGYAKWAEDCGPDAIVYDTSWCSVMNTDYKMP